jgi:adenosylmethionine-8-amino-7-oxononanoate aminotransferase
MTQEDAGPTGKVAIEDARDGNGFYLRIMAENGLTLAHSETYTGHRSGEEVAQTLIDAMSNPQITDNRRPKGAPAIEGQESLLADEQEAVPDA